MRVKGTAYLARIQLLRAKLGDEALAAFLAGFRARHPEFPREVLVTTQIPAAEFVALMDAIVTEIYAGDTASLWEIGERAAEWSLREGPYRNLLEGREIARFAALAPVLYRNYFDTGEARSLVHVHHVDLWIAGIPAELRHLYFEYSVVGYFRRGLELLGANVRLECVRGFSRGDDEVHYRVWLG